MRWCAGKGWRKGLRDSRGDGWGTREVRRQRDGGCTRDGRGVHRRGGGSKWTAVDTQEHNPQDITRDGDQDHQNQQITRSGSPGKRVQYILRVSQSLSV